MKAAVCYEFGVPLVVEELSLPSAKAGEVHVKIKACAICHSDIAYMEGEWGGTLPAVFGHEACGIVEACGDGVTNFQKGDKVLVTLLRSCGACPECQGGKGYICSTGHPLDEVGLRNESGVEIFRGLKTAAFAEEVVVDSSQLVKLPDSLDFAEASLLACGVLTGFGAVSNVARPQAGQSAVVIGCGGVGLNTIQGLRLSGAHPIIAIDLVDSKLEAAKKFGATHIINAKAADAESAVKDLTSGRGADFVFTAAGGSKAVMSSFPLLALAGSLVIVGMTSNGDFSELDSTDIANGNKKILGSKMGSSLLNVDIPRLLALHADGKLLLKELISGTYPLQDINTAIDEVKADKALRNVVVF